MKTALVIGASGGIGSAVARDLAGRGWSVTALARSHDGLDVTDEASVEAALGALSGTFDLIFVATGALEIDGNVPEKSLREITPEALVGQFLLNAVGPALVLKHALRLLPKDRPAVFAVLSARVGSIGDNRLGGWHAYRAAKAALNQLIHGASIELKRTHRQAVAVCLHPGTVETAFTAKYGARHQTVPPAEAAAHIVNVIASLGPEHSGGFYDYLGREIPW